MTEAQIKLNILLQNCEPLEVYIDDKNVMILLSHVNARKKVIHNILLEDMAHRNEVWLDNDNVVCERYIKIRKMLWRQYIGEMV